MRRRIAHDREREMNNVLTLIFAVIAIICAFGWIINRIIARGAILYIIEECGKAPIRGELGPYIRKATKQMFLKKS